MPRSPSAKTTNRPDAQQIIPPSLLVRLVMGPMTKVLNPFIRGLAGRRFTGMAALIRHEGRKSGKTYSTPVGAHVKEGVCVVPLTFGTESDWCRNIRASGRGSLRWKAKDYALSTPIVLTVDQGRSLLRQNYPAPFRFGFKMLGIKAFMRMEADPLR